MVPKQFEINIPNTKVHKLGQLTLHKYPKITVLDGFKKHIQENKVELANLVGAEIICSGGYLQFWDLIFESCAENLVFILTPKLAYWLLDEYKFLNSLRTKYHSQLPNNQEARNHLSQIISVLCLAPKNNLTIPQSGFKTTLDNKSKYLAEEHFMLASPTGTAADLDNLKNCLNHFIYHINREEAKYCLYWINQVIRMKNIKIRPFNNFKIAKSISTNPIWIIWNFIFIRVPAGELKSFLDQIINIFAITLTKKNYRAASFLVFSGLLVLKYQKQIKWNEKIPTQDPICIKTVSKINFIYQYLNREDLTITFFKLG